MTALEITNGIVFWIVAAFVAAPVLGFLGFALWALGQK